MNLFISGNKLFISKLRDMVVIPYKIDLEDMMMKYQYWLSGGGVISEWGSISELEDYEFVDLKKLPKSFTTDISINNFTEQKADAIFKAYEDDLVHEEILGNFKVTVADLRDGDIANIRYHDHTSFDYEFIIKDNRFKFKPLEKNCTKHFNFSNYNRREFEEHLIAKLVKKEVKDIQILEYADVLDYE